MYACPSERDLGNRPTLEPDTGPKGIGAILACRDLSRLIRRSHGDPPKGASLQIRSSGQGECSLILAWFPDSPDACTWAAEVIGAFPARWEQSQLPFDPSECSSRVSLPFSR